MAEKDRIEGFIRGLYRKGEKECYSKAEILAEARKEIKDSEGYRWLFEMLPEHDYDERTLQNAVASLLARRA